MEKILKQKNGITLIALVITIIVLLILAGISISMLSGDNSILQKVTDSKVLTGIGQEKENISLAYNSVIIDKTSKGDTSAVTAIELEPAIKNYDAGASTEDKDSQIIVSFENGHKYSIDSEGSITDLPPSSNQNILTASDIASSNEKMNYYGKTVNYSINGLSDWKIFYADASNIFLIYSYYLPIEKVPNIEGMTTGQTYNVYWPNNGEIGQTININTCPSRFLWSEATEYALPWTTYGTRSTGCASNLIYTANWESFVDTEFADYAIGTPTLQMWLESWNATHSNNVIYANATNNSGYYVGSISSPTTDYFSYNSNTDSLYNPYTSKESGCSGYWLSAPSAKGPIYLMHVGYPGYISRTTYYCNENAYYSLRPIVSLRDDVALISGTTYDYNLKLGE